MATTWKPLDDAVYGNGQSLSAFISDALVTQASQTLGNRAWQGTWSWAQVIHNNDSQSNNCTRFVRFGSHPNRPCGEI